MKASFAGDALRDVLCDLCDERARAAFTSEAHTGLPERPGQRHDGRVKSRATRLRLLRERLALDGDESGFSVIFPPAITGNARTSASAARTPPMSTKTQSGDLFAKISAKKVVSSRTSSRSKVIPGYLAPLRRTFRRDVQADDVVFRPDSLRHAFRRVPVRAADVHAHFPGLGASARGDETCQSNARAEPRRSSPERPGVARLARANFARRSTAAAASSRSVAGFGDEVERVALERGRRGHDRGHLGGIRTARFRRHPDASARRARRGMGRDDVVVSSRRCDKGCQTGKVFRCLRQTALRSSSFGVARAAVGSRARARWRHQAPPDFGSYTDAQLEPPPPGGGVVLRRSGRSTAPRSSSPRSAEHDVPTRRPGRGLAFGASVPERRGAGAVHRADR